MVNDDNRTGSKESTDKSRGVNLNDEKSGRVGRRTFLRATGSGVALTAAAGCLGGDGGDGGDGGGDGGDGGGAGTATGTPSPTPPPISGTIKVGAMGPADSPFGVSILRTAQLAAQQFNDADGIAGHDVEVITKDTKDDPGTARSVYQELIEGEGVDLTVGIFGSEQLLALLPNISQNDVLHLSTGAATPEATRTVSEAYEKFKTYFRVGPLNSVYLARADVLYGKAMFEAMGWDRVAYIAEDFKWTQPKSKIVPKGFKEDVGVEVPVNKRISEGTEDWTPIYDEVQNADVDGVYTALAHMGTTSLVQWAKQQRPFGYGGIHVPAQLVAYYDLVKGAAEGVFTQTSATPETELTPKTVPYAEAYNEAFDSFPVYDGYTTHDAMNIFKLAAEEAQSTSGEYLVPIIEEMSYEGTAGNVEFYGRDHEFTHDVKFGREFVFPIYFQWQDGVQAVIWPDDVATAEYKQPPSVQG